MDKVIENKIRKRIGEVQDLDEGREIVFEDRANDDIPPEEAHVYMVIRQRGGGENCYTFVFCNSDKVMTADEFNRRINSFCTEGMPETEDDQVLAVFDNLTISQVEALMVLNATFATNIQNKINHAAEIAFQRVDQLEKSSGGKPPKYRLG